MRRRSVLLALNIAQYSYYQGVARYAHEHHWHLVPDMVYTGKIPLGWKGDGLITFLGDRHDLVDFVLSVDVPVVELSLVRSDIDLPRVEGDSATIGRLAAEHFLERGFKNFAWAPFTEDLVNRERYNGFAGVLSQKFYPCHVLPPAHRSGGPQWQVDWSSRRRELLREIRKLPRPLGVFCYNDCIAADLLCVCEEAGFLVPEQIAILGTDNDPFICEYVSVPLSSVWHDLERMAYEGAALLDRLMKGQPRPQEVLRIPPRGVVTRKSTDILAVEDLKVARALRFVREVYTHPWLSVSDVVKATGFSRRPLERAFSRYLGRSIHDEILRLRTNKAVELLAHTDLTVAAISEATGSPSANYLFRVFRRLQGTSPNAYRQWCHRQSQG